MSDNSSSSELSTPTRKVGPYEAGLFAALGMKPSVHTNQDETIVRTRVKGEVYEGSSLLGREEAMRDLLSELPEPLALKVHRHLA